jgi:hypothetical protein
MAYSLGEWRVELQLKRRVLNERRRALALGGTLVIVAATALALSLTTTRGSATSALPNAGKDNALLASVLQGLKTDLPSVTVGPPPAAVSATANTAWLDVTHSAGEALPEIDQDAWYAYLIAGAYGAQCSAQGADCLQGYVFQGSNGSAEGDSSARLVMQEVTPSSATPHDLSTTIAQRLAAEGITASSISFVKPYGLAAIVEIKSSDPQTTIDSLKAGTVFSGLGLDGYLTRIVDSSGDIVFLAAVSDRSQAGQGYVQPGLTVPNLP